MGKLKLKTSLQRLQSAAQHSSKKSSNRVIKKTTPAPEIVKKKPADGQSKRRREFVPYSNLDRVLLVGEGNFSFANALCLLALSGEILTATAYDSQEICYEKYEDAKDYVDSILELGGSVLFDVNAMDLAQCKPLKNRLFHKIIFNFPHIGLGIKDQTRNIVANQELLLHFFHSARPYLAKAKSEKDSDWTHGSEPSIQGEIHVTIKSGNPYELWGIKKLAKSAGLETKSSFEFRPELYPGYEHRRTLGFAEGKSKADNEDIAKGARTYVFCVDDKEKHVLRKKQKQRQQQLSKGRKPRGKDDDD